jgi:hypothetical protein
MIRSQWAFIRGARGAVCRMWVSAARKSASHAGEYLPSRSRGRNRIELRRVARLRAC